MGLRSRRGRIAALCVMLGGSACNHNASLESEAESLRQDTVPGEARELVVAPDKRDRVSVQRAWTFRLDWDRGRYESWAREHVGREFTPEPAAHGLRFRRQLPGDVQSLTIEPQQGAELLFVRVQFLSIAD